MLTTSAGKEQPRATKLSSALSNTVVIVTGASSGIGAATAREFALHGAHVPLARETCDATEIICSYFPKRPKATHAS